MNISFHTGKTAMIAQAKALNVYGNNIANVNTVGYQTLRPDFADCIYETERRPEADWQTGHGTYIQKTDLMFAESFFNETDRPQDMAIAGEGFFAVEDRWGNVNYTRDGKFGLTQLDGTWFLVSSQGEYVLDYDKQRIEVPFEEMSRNDIIERVDWNAITAQVGAFSVNGGAANKIRYTYSGNSNSQNPPRVLNAQKQITPSSEDPLNSASITTPTGYYAVRGKYDSEVFYTHDEQLSIQDYEGKWVLGSTNGELVLDERLQPIPVVFNPTNGDIDTKNVQRDAQGRVAVLGADGQTEFRDNVTFNVAQDGGKWFIVTQDAEYVLNNSNKRIEVKYGDGNYFGVDWENARDKVGVFAVPEDELTTSDQTRYDTAATANAAFDKLLDGNAPGGITLGDKDAFFAVEGTDGIRYTRNAKLDIMKGDDGAWYLSTVQGEYVLDNNNARITVSEPLYTGNVDWAGVHEAVGVFVFPNPYGIDALGSNRYLETGRSGEAVADREMTKLPYALIASNVELSDQMVKLIETQRAYQLSSRVVTTSDELAQISNNLR